MRLSMRLKIAGLVGVATGLTATLNTIVFHLLHEDAPAGELARGLGAAFLIGAVAAGVAYLVARRLTQPLERLRDAAVAIAAGDLTRHIDVDATAETADLAASFGAMIEGLQATIGELRGAALTLDGRSGDILGSVTRQAAMAAQQAAAINETSTTASEIAQTSKQATQHADSVIEMTRRSDDLSQEGLQTVEEAVRSSASLGEQVNAIAATMTGLSERTLQIGEIIASVKDLAEQSNLLALNASIEASKAGEHGRGFAVVAMEMRNLAEQSRQAAVQIRGILQEIQRSARDAAAATDEGAKRAAAAMGLARSAGEAIEGLAMVIRESAVAARQIANNTRQQTIGVDQMVAAISELSQAINESAEGTRSIEKGTAALSEISRQLSAAVQRYRV
ncbi:methyl-accepting chemotaxis protein [Anaeromyxobacter sp. Fw109-5]|uniref:methyl-accepting chemotaxis protein n=1 Tax=Anaeromyxobacter sp. (strain Fw109-5) TaxID=404589 RepID=UPI0000ED736A|nr:methyl-accepting chemotaxis protein [Anaeromyxobacter sp. Fw109-5]ABS26601.1 methyl-accepting chemotaxis sensory transducer [Anaeromyxobacter sp. Fw109-5]